MVGIMDATCKRINCQSVRDLSGAREPTNRAADSTHVGFQLCLSSDDYHWRGVAGLNPTSADMAAKSDSCMNMDYFGLDAAVLHKAVS